MVSTATGLLWMFYVLTIQLWDLLEGKLRLNALQYSRHDKYNDAAHLAHITDFSVHLQPGCSPQADGLGSFTMQRVHDSAT